MVSIKGFLAAPPGRSPKNTGIGNTFNTFN